MDPSVKEEESDATVPERLPAGKRNKKERRKKTRGEKKPFSLSCSRRKKSSMKKRKGKRKEKTMKASRKSRKMVKAKSRKARKQRSRSKSKRVSRSKSRSRSRSRSRSKSKSKSKSKRQSKSTSRSKSKSSRVKSQQSLIENRQHLIRSQSLSASQPGSEKVFSKPDMAPTGVPSQQSEDMPKPIQPAVDTNPEFQPHRQTEERASRKEDGAPPSTAIDIDNSMRQRRPRRTQQPADVDYKSKGREKHQQIDAYSGEFVKGKDNKYQRAKSRQVISFEPSIGATDAQPAEEIDPSYPAQRLVISNFVRNACRMKRWLYEDSYPISGARPAINDLICNKPEKYALRKCCCGRRNVCDRSCEEEFTNKRNSANENAEYERIRGELQRLDVILKNLDD